MFPHVSPPASEPATYEFLWRCAAMAAKVRGLSGSDLYTIDEIYGFLKEKAPDTYALVQEFSTAYVHLAELLLKTAKAREENQCDPCSLRELEKLTEQKDEVRHRLLVHLGLE